MQDRKRFAAFTLRLRVAQANRKHRARRSGNDRGMSGRPGPTFASMRTLLPACARLAVTVPLAALLSFITLYAAPKSPEPCIDQNGLEERFFGPSTSFGHVDTDGSTPALCHSPHVASYAASVAVAVLILALGGRWIHSSRRQRIGSAS